jgi:hypothetical protein
MIDRNVDSERSPSVFQHHCISLQSGQLVLYVSILTVSKRVGESRSMKTEAHGNSRQRSERSKPRHVMSNDVALSHTSRDLSTDASPTSTQLAGGNFPIFLSIHFSIVPSNTFKA